MNKKNKIKNNIKGSKKIDTLKKCKHHPYTVLTQDDKNLLLEALEKTLGVKSSACKLVNISRGAFYAACKNDKEFAKAVDEIEEYTIDMVETAFYKKIFAKENADTTAMIFFLKTRGKKHGWNEKYQIEHSGKIENIHELSDDILMQLANEE